MVAGGEVDLDPAEETEEHCAAGREKGLHNSSPSLIVMKIRSPF